MFIFDKLNNTYKNIFINDKKIHLLLEYGNIFILITLKIVNILYVFKILNFHISYFMILFLSLSKFFILRITVIFFI